MSESIPASLARQVVARAHETCEYCRLPQWSQEATFHIDHIQPRADGGETIEDNLALACVSCSLKKSARIHVRDPETKKFVRLFHQETTVGRIIFAGHAPGALLERRPLLEQPSRLLE